MTYFNSHWIRSLFLLGTFSGLIVVSSVFAGETQRYGEYSLEEWQQIVKSTNFTTLGQPKYVNGLIEIVADKNAPWANRRQAAKTLGRIGEPAAEAVPVLKEILLNPGEDATSTRLWVLSALALFKTVAQEVTPHVSDIVLDEQEPHLIRVNALETLGRVGKESELSLSTFSKLLSEDIASNETQRNELRLAATEATWILGPSALPLLPLLMNNSSDDWSAIRLASSNAIGAIGPQAEVAVPLLVDIMLFDDVEAVREISADALGKIGSPAIPALEQLLSDPEEQIRLYVIRAFKQMSSSSEVIRLLQSALNDEAEIVSVAAAKELVNRKPDEREAHKILIQSLEHENRRVRLNAYNAIYEVLINSPDLQRALSQYAENADSGNVGRTAAKKLLRKIQFDQM